MNNLGECGVFNVTVCIIGILILTIHIINILIKKENRQDEKRLCEFFVFTAIHFMVYLVFTFVKMAYTSDTFIITFYTIFYIMNNIEVLLLYRYMCSYTQLPVKSAKILSVLNISLLSIFTVLDIINIFTGIFFFADNGVYVRSGTMIISQGYQFVMFIAILLVTVTNSKLNKREKVAFALYCILPFVAIIIQNMFKGYAIAYASIIVAIEILLAFLSVEKKLELAKEQEKVQDAQIKIMLSQIQPHFVYNSLSSISTLIEIDAKKAQSALDDFTEYLRRNLSSLTETGLIPFEEELKHIKTYISLEKMRFGDKVNVIYDIQTTDFVVPPLSIQPVVENAIKHGILKKLKGGTIIIKTRRKPYSYVVEIIDDGIGFNPRSVRDDGNKHFGLNNIKYRIEKMCNGHILVDSELNKGTHITITFYK